jgi:hypothetical protein
MTLPRGQPDRRPEWCGHEECRPIVSFQGKCCGGRLPKPVPHDEDFNTHRLCIETGDEEIFDLMVNRTDLFILSRLVSEVHLNTVTREI